MKEKFSLKDHLFHPKKVQYLARLIKDVYPTFEEKAFIKQTLEKFPKLELKQRIMWMREKLQEFLPQDYKKAVNILLKALPKECDPHKTDNDFGDFIIAPVGDFVAAYGCTQKHLLFSLSALKEITKRFSVEDPIRYFLLDFPKETMSELKKWTKDLHYHVRRLASEGTRPSLPWSPKVSLNSKEVIKDILDNLYDDKTRYVVRSIANHLNDIAKKDPDLVLQTLKRWKKSKKQDPKEMEYLSNHALRTLIKEGNKDALAFLGYNSNVNIEVTNVSIDTPTVVLGEAVYFSFTIAAHEDAHLMIDYIMHFVGKNGKPRKKVFKIKKKVMKKGEQVDIKKKHPLKIMTTRALYPGKHIITIQINGKAYGEQSFMLKT